MIQIVSATRFKTLARRKIATASLGVCKQVIAPASGLEGDRRALRFVISNGDVDRELDTIAVEGWDLRNYQRNPVVLWGHDASRLPIGRAFDVGVEDGALKASVEFVPADLPEGGAFADSVYRLARSGFIAATSVGFRPIKYEYSHDKDRGADDWFPGIDFLEQELVELSIVTVPANPDALLEEPGDSTAVATPSSDTGEELTAFNQEQARARARLRRMLQLATARIADVDPVPDVPRNHAGATRRA